jgi:hypothetical protein
MAFSMCAYGAWRQRTGSDGMLWQQQQHQLFSMLIVLALLLLCQIPTITASEGDRDPSYRQCVVTVIFTIDSLTHIITTDAPLLAIRLLC